VPFSNAFSQLFTQYSVIAWVVFGLVMVGLLAAIVMSWYRTRRGLGPSQQDKASRLEKGYIAALIGMVIFLVISSFAANAKDFPDPPKPAAQVRVTSYQWCWRFRYEGTPVASNGQCQGSQRLLPVLVVPAGQPVRLDVTSADVVHAVWVPQWRFKLYAYPGITQHLTITIPRTGRWIGRCAQLCGLYHYEMDFYLRAVSPAAFTRFLHAGVTP
jgi:cytochrome c oxidase subunit II